MKLLFIFLISACTLVAQTPEWSRKYHTGSVTCLDFSSDGKKLLSGGKDKIVILWDVLKKDTVKTYSDIRFPITSLDFSSDNEWFLGSSLDTSNIFYNNKIIFTAKLSDTNTLLAIKHYSFVFTDGSGFINSIEKGHNNQSYLLDDSTVLNFLVGDQFSITYDGIGTWAGSTGKVTKCKLAVQDVRGKWLDREYFYHVIPSLNRNLYFFFSNNPSIYNAGNNTKKYIPSANGSAAFSADDSTFIIDKKNNELHIFSTQGEYLTKVSSEISRTTALATDYSNRYYISSHIDSSLRIWTVGIADVFKKVLLKSPVTTITVSPDSIHFATAHTDGTVTLWNMDSLNHYAMRDTVFTPSVTKLSDNKNVCVGDSAEFTVEAVSNFGELLTYQWQKNGIDLADNDFKTGTKSTRLILNQTDTSHSGAYTAKIKTDRNWEVISSPIHFNSLDIPVIIEEPPQQITLYHGQQLNLTVKLLNSVGVRYEWYKNGNLYSQINDPSFRIFKATSSDAGIYNVKVINQCGSVTSNEFNLSFPTNIKEITFKNIQFSVEPNPFKSSTTIHFSLPKSLKIKLAVTDILGKEIAVLKDEFTEMGEQSVVFKNENLPDGMYYITLSGEGVLKTIPVQITR